MHGGVEESAPNFGSAKKSRRDRQRTGERIDVRLQGHCRRQSRHRQRLTRELPRSRGNRFLGVEDDNVFYQHLRQMDNLSDFYQMRLPVGDVDEMVVVNQALQNNRYQDLMSLANRYGADRVLIVWANPKSYENWRLTTLVVPDEKISHQNVDVDNWYETLSLDDAWQQMLDVMEENWRQADTIESRDNTYYVRLKETSLQMWARDEKKFRQLEFLQDLTVRGAYKDQILISFSFAGTSQELSENWDKAGWIWQSDLTGPGGTLTRKEVYYE